MRERVRREIVEGERESLLRREGEERRETGSVTWRVYWEYFRSIGVWNAIGIAISYAIQQSCYIGAQLWLARWSARSDDPNSGSHTLTNLTIYSALSLISCFGVLLRSISLLFGSLRASRRLHEGMLDSVMSAPMSFFDVTPLGRIVNRFSKDIYTVDETLPDGLGMWMSAVVYSLSIVTIVLVPLPYYAAILVCVALTLSLSLSLTHFLSLTHSLSLTLSFAGTSHVRISFHPKILPPIVARAATFGRPLPQPNIHPFRRNAKWRHDSSLLRPHIRIH